MLQSPTWYLGYDLKRSYQPNLLKSMVLVYGTVIAATVVGLIVQTQSSPPLETPLIMQGSLPSDLTVGRKPNSPPGKEGSGTNRVSRSVENMLSGHLFGANIRIVPDVEMAVPGATHYQAPVLEPMQPEFDHQLGQADLDLAVSGSGGGDGDYGLPEIPSARYIGSPRFPDWEMRHQIKGGRTRAARVFFGGLYWPDRVPAAAVCTVFVEITFFVDGHLEWNINRYALDTSYSGFIPVFKRQVDAALRRTWFQAALLNGVKVNQVADLLAIFCPDCEAKAWTERGDMEVFLKK